MKPYYSTTNSVRGIPTPESLLYKKSTPQENLEKTKERGKLIDSLRQQIDAIQSNLITERDLYASRNQALIKRLETTITDPTTGGVTASFAMLGDINIAEPGALIAFAGPRVVKETIGRDLPDGFQTSEFLLEHGFLDYIIDRTEIREKLGLSLKLFMK